MLTSSDLLLEFLPIENPLSVGSVLTERLPISTNIYNVMRLHRTWGNNQKWFSLEDPNVQEVWVVATFYRKDLGQVICISRPPTATITAQVSAAFSNCDFIDWSDSFYMAAVDLEVSSMVTHISTRHHGNWTNVHPAFLYTMAREDALNLNIQTPENIEVKSINDAAGKEFIMKTWKYARPGTDEYLEDSLKRNLSAGVYVNGEIVADAVFDGHGLIGMLYASNAYRGQGFGQLVMHQLMKSSAENDFIPGSTVEVRNNVANSFMRKIGYKVAGQVDYVVYHKSVQ